MLRILIAINDTVSVSYMKILKYYSGCSTYFDTDISDTKMRILPENRIPK